MKRYNLDEDISIKKFEEGINATSFCVSTKNKNYVLKILADSEKPKDILLRIDFINYLCKNKFSTNKVIKNKNKEFITRDNGRMFLLISYVDGDTIPWEKIAITTAKELAIFVSKLYKLSLKYHNKNNISTTLDAEHLAGLSNAMKKNVDFNNIRKSIIHSDISRENILVNGKRIKSIIDFDDLQTNYLIWDYATLITQVFVTRTYGIDWEALNSFHDEFSKNFKWNTDELSIIIPLMIHRNKLIYNEFSKKYPQSKKVQSIMNSVKHKTKLIKDDTGRLSDIFSPLR